MGDFTRNLWRRIPESTRHSLYQRIMLSKNPVIKFLVRVVIGITLYRHRWVARSLWPEARGFDHLALAVWSQLTRFHEPALALMWRWGYLARSWRRPRPVNPANRVIAHATGSFDVGGTQTQIKHLCTATDTRFVHEAVEIFPELNYLYRRGATIDSSRYVKGGLASRTFGRLVSNRNYRSSQLVQIYKLACDFRALNADVVVGWGHEMCVTAFIAAAIARVPHIVFCIRTVNPNYGWVDPPFPKLLLRAHRHMLPKVSRTVVNSTLLQGDHAAWVRSSPESIDVCANGISVETLSPEAAAAARAATRAAHSIAPETIVILTLGRFSWEKGQVWLVEANRLLHERGTAPPFVFLMYGDGVTVDVVKERAAKYNLTNMIFAGRTDRAHEVLYAADIFVMPSNYEGMPNAMMEAMAVGLPCVSTTRSGALDVARPDREALYYDTTNFLKLAQHLERLMQDPDERRAFGEAARSRIEGFSVRRFVDRFEAIVDDMRATPPPS